MTALSPIDESRYFLTSTQALMVDALLGEDEIARQAARAWVAAVDFDAIEAASYRLVPAIYARHSATDVLGHLHGRMKGIYRYYFYRNNRYLSRIESFLAALATAGIEFIVFKGTAVLLQYHKSAALRSFGDCDILVHPADKDRAERVMLEHGLTYRYDAARKPTDSHSHDYVDADGNGFDLHWFALVESRGRGVDDSLWARARIIEWRGQHLRVLAPEDEVLVAGINAIRDPGESRADWLYDAAMIFGATPSFDWRALRDELARRGLAADFIAVLSMLQRFVPNFPAEPAKEAFADHVFDHVRRLVSEMRDVAGEEEDDRAIDLLFAPTGLWAPLALQIGRLRRWWHAVSSPGVRHVGYERHRDGTVSKLRFHRSIWPHIPVIFEVLDDEAFSCAVQSRGQGNEILMTLPAGCLGIPLPTRRQTYAATIVPTLSAVRFVERGDDVLSIQVSITNAGVEPWRVFPGNEMKFCLSYHLLSESGENLLWDLPRKAFVAAYQNHAALVLPGDSISAELELQRPQAAGRYWAQLDIVHEHVAWFSLEDRRLPKIAIEVF